MSKTRIALMHYATPPGIGGVESTIGAQASLLAGAGYDVRVATGRGECFDPRVPVNVIPELSSSHPVVLQVQRQLATGVVDGAFHSLVRELYDRLATVLDVDVCIAHNLLTLHKNLAATTALHALVAAGRLRLVAWSHDFAWGDPIYAADLHPGLPWDLLRRPWPGVRYVVVSDSRRRELAALLELDSREIEAVPPGIDPLEFLGVSPAAASWAAEFRLLESTPLLLLPARVTRRKNIELAVEITAALRTHGLSPVLLVMGPLGPHNPANTSYLSELRELQKRHNLVAGVIFLQAGGRPVDDAARRDLYLLADVLLFPSRREGFGIPVLEAGLVRLPIFCADIPPFHESAGPHANYFGLDEPPAEIASRLAAFLEKDSRYQLKRRVLSEYAWERILSRTQAIIEDVTTDAGTL